MRATCCSSWSWSAAAIPPRSASCWTRKHLRLFGKDKPEVLVASCMYDNEAINSHVYNNIGRCDKIVNLHWEQMLSDTQEAGDWFNMNGNAKQLRADLLGQAHRRPPAAPTAWTPEHPRDRRRHDGLSAAWS